MEKYFKIIKKMANAESEYSKQVREKIKLTKNNILV